MLNFLITNYLSKNLDLNNTYYWDKIWFIFINHASIVYISIFVFILGILLPNKAKIVKYTNFISAYYLFIFLYIASFEFTFDLINLKSFFQQNNTPYSNLFFIIATITVFIFFLSISDTSYLQENTKIEFTFLVFCIYISSLFLITSLDFIAIIILLECISFSSYVLVGFERKNKFSTASSLKYLILASIPSGFFILGISILYHNYGTFNQNYLEMVMLSFEKFQLAGTVNFTRKGVCMECYSPEMIWQLLDDKLIIDFYQVIINFDKLALKISPMVLFTILFLRENCLQDKWLVYNFCYGTDCFSILDNFLNNGQFIGLTLDASTINYILNVYPDFFENEFMLYLDIKRQELAGRLVFETFVNNYQDLFKYYFNFMLLIRSLIFYKILIQEFFFIYAAYYKNIALLLNSENEFIKFFSVETLIENPLNTFIDFCCQEDSKQIGFRFHGITKWLSVFSTILGYIEVLYVAEIYPSSIIPYEFGQIPKILKQNLYYFGLEAQSEVIANFIANRSMHQNFSFLTFISQNSEIISLLNNHSTFKNDWIFFTQFNLFIKNVVNEHTQLITTLNLYNRLVFELNFDKNFLTNFVSSTEYYPDFFTYNLTDYLIKYSNVVLPSTYLAIIFIILNFAFKLTAAPFHFWAPIVYGGAPLPTLMFLSIFSKLTIIFLIIGWFSTIFDIFKSIWQPIFVFFSLLSVFVSVLGAFSEKIIKRFFIYSSIGHVGFMLAGIAAANYEGIQATINYLIIYIISSFLFWNIIMLLSKKTTHLIHLKGLAYRNQTLAWILVITLFSLSGLPPLAGFFVKFEIFNSLLKSSQYYTAFILFILTVFSFFYYLRIIKIIYFENKSVKSLRNLNETKLRIISILVFILPLYVFFMQEPFYYILKNIITSSL